MSEARPPRPRRARQARRRLVGYVLRNRGFYALWLLASVVYVAGWVAVPKLVAHSREDDVIPYELGRDLYESAADPKQFVEMAGGHNDVPWEACPAYWDALETFVCRVLTP